MPTSLKYYKDKERASKYRKKDKDKYYSKNKGNWFNQGKPWSKEELKQILFAPKTDTQLSTELGRSITSIQIQRCRAKKHLTDFI